MKILYYDCFSGISGDMNLGAMLDLGVDKELLLKELSALGLEEEYEIHIGYGSKKGISGTRVEITLKESAQDPVKARNIKDIQKIINESTLSPEVKRKSLEMFGLLADAEAGVHGKDIDEIHFHEVGATDAILDIVGAAFCLDYLKVDKVMASSVELGGGLVRCAHGILPVPAPAVVRLLENIPVKMGGVEAEATTPTGAVILAANVQEYTDRVEFIIEKTGYGIGKKDFEIPNVLRIYLGQLPVQKAEKRADPEHSVLDFKINETDSNLETETQYILETNIDDMNPEIYQYVEEILYARGGALDVFKTPIIMKKGRPGVKLSVLVKKEDISKAEKVIYLETSSIGLRIIPVIKRRLAREITQVSTRFGPVAVKYSCLDGMIKSKPEYEDCKRLAVEHGVPLNDLYLEIIKEIELREKDWNKGLD